MNSDEKQELEAKNATNFITLCCKLIHFSGHRLKSRSDLSFKITNLLPTPESGPEPGTIWSYFNLTMNFDLPNSDKMILKTIVVREGTIIDRSAWQEMEKKASDLIVKYILKTEVPVPYLYNKDEDYLW